MDVNRRRLLLNFAAATSIAPSILSRSVAGGDFHLNCEPEAGPTKWHPMVEEILRRARSRSPNFDRGLVEYAIEERASATSRPVERLKWFESPAKAHCYLKGLGLEALIAADRGAFWSTNESDPLSKNFEFPESAHAAQREAENVFFVADHEAYVAAPKLKARAQAITRGATREEVFGIRAISSQIGWLETVIARAAAYSLYQVELLLSLGANPDSTEVKTRINIFDAYENGLLATWETFDEMICVPVGTACAERSILEQETAL